MVLRSKEVKHLITYILRLYLEDGYQFLPQFHPSSAPVGFAENHPSFVQVLSNP
jgi:hypothetical protein